MDCVRITFDGNLFHLAEGLFKKVLPTYYTVIVLGQDRSIQAFVHPDNILLQSNYGRLFSH